MQQHHEIGFAFGQPDRSKALQRSEGAAILRWIGLDCVLPPP
jgi:hypothetical protein